MAAKKGTLPLHINPFIEGVCRQKAQIGFDHSVIGNEKKTMQTTVETERNALKAEQGQIKEITISGENAPHAVQVISLFRDQLAAALVSPISIQAQNDALKAEVEALKAQLANVSKKRSA